MNRPILKNGEWHCGKCHGIIDTGFIDRPRRCEAVGCGEIIDWIDRPTGLDSRVEMLEYRVAVLLDVLKKNGLLDTDYRFKE